MRGFQPATKKPTKGGPVRGPGTGTSDEVADTVADGTYIMPTDSTKAIGEQNLAAMGKGAPVDVQLSNGEFKMPPEQVHAIGVQALDQMKDATHTPVAARGFAPGAQQQAEPPLFFVNGGEVDEENRSRFAQVPESFGNRGNNTFGAAPPEAPAAPLARPERQSAPAAPPVVASPNQASPDNIFPQASPSAGANVYGAAGFSADQFGSSGKFANVPSSIGHQPGRQPAAQPAAPVQPGMTDAQREQAISQIPTGGLNTPARPAPAAPAVAAQPAAPTAAGFMPGTRAVFNESGNAIGDLARQGRYGAAAGETARAALSYVPALADDVIGGPVRAVGPAVLDAGKQFLGINSDPAPVPAATTTASPSAAGATQGAVVPTPHSQLAKQLGGLDQRHAQNVQLQQPARDPAQGQASSAAGAEVNKEIAPGIFRNGNSYSDSAEGALAGREPRGLPIAQNMAAADALAQRSQQESMSRVMAGQPTERGWSGVIGQVAGNGNMWSRTPEQQQRDAEVSASSIVNPAQARGLFAMRRISDLDKARLAQVNNEVDLEKTRMQGQASRDVAAMREAGDNGRAVLREAGETGRADARNAIEQDRLGLEQKVRGFDIRAGQRQEKLYEKYDAAKTPKEKSAIVQQIRDLSGKAEPTNRYTVVPGGQEWDATAGAMRNVPGRVLNNQTGQFVEQQGATSAQPAGIPKVGDTRDGYRYKGGNPNDKANWQKV